MALDTRTYPDASRRVHGPGFHLGLVLFADSPSYRDAVLHIWFKSKELKNFDSKYGQLGPIYDMGIMHYVCIVLLWPPSTCTSRLLLTCGANMY
jgi:hypothetical protein